MKPKHFFLAALAIGTTSPLLAEAGVVCIPAMQTSPNITGSSGFPPCPPGTVPSSNAISGGLTVEGGGWAASGGPRVTGLDASSVGGHRGMAGPAGAGKSIDGSGAPRSDAPKGSP